ncbi:hypothetical protein DNTS_018276 [Danionella cerebrum]|uniref:Uncharacterized protein n=1 Tax=Danionella cerebrum TaxID=2873325 RepID=A0A553RK62_9TELE|nr:hypothetical protein DNTS_018276 [Danionella translucida]
MLETPAKYLKEKSDLFEWYLTASATLEDIGRSDAYKRTQETLSQAGQVTSAAFTSMGSAIRSRFGEMR